MGFLRKPKESGGDACVIAELIDPDFVHRHPALAEFLSSEVWDDGTERQTGTLFLFIVSGRWRCMLKDRALGLISFWSAQALDELWMLLETGLQEGTVDWKSDRKPAGRGR